MFRVFLSLILVGAIISTQADPQTQVNAPSQTAPCMPVPSVPAPQPDMDNRLIQVAILLDVSSSMDGLINQAKSELWSVVNEVAKAKKYGREAMLQIAIYDYGKSSHPVEKGYIRKVMDFSSEISYRVQKEAFDYLDAPILRVCSADASMHYAPTLVAAFLPDITKVVKAVKDVMYIQK